MVVTLSLSFSGCGSDDDEKSETDQQIEKLNGTWKATSVKYQGTDVTDYTNFTITITGAAGSKSVGYTTSGRPSGKLSPWNSTGTFQFGAKPATELIREDDVDIAYSVTTTALEMSFNYEGEGHLGREQSIGGDWVFQFTKQ